MHGEAKESAEIDNEKEIVDISVVQTIGKDKFGSITQSGLQDALDKNAGEEKTKATPNGENFIVEFLESNRFYEVVSDGNSYAGAGGIVGYVESGKVIIENCYNTGNVTSSKYQGGIIGNKNGMEVTLNNCFFLNNINSGIGDSTGGISVSAEQLKNNEKIEGKYIIDILNDFAKEYNEKENSLKLNYWKIDPNSTYPVFEE